MKKQTRNPIAIEAIPTGNESEYYWIGVMCRNCGLSKTLAFKKRLQVYMHRCPKCEVQFLNSKTY